MTSVVKPHNIVLAAILQILVLIGSLFVINSAYADSPDPTGNNAEVYNISITPSSVQAGTYPWIIGFVHNTSAATNGTDGKATFHITAIITYPNGQQKEQHWHNMAFSADQKAHYTVDNNFDINEAGTYKVDYYVYNSERTHQYASLSKSFFAAGPSIPSKVVRPKKRIPPPAPPKKEPEPEQVAALTAALVTAQTPTPKKDDGRRYLGIGAFANTANFSAGPTILFWPLKNLAIQGSYGFGTFTSYEVRSFYRWNLYKYLNPYLGAGFLYAERDATINLVKTKVSGSSFTGFLGAEVPLMKNLSAYIDVSGTGMKLEKTVTSGGNKITGKVSYSPVTLNLGIAYYFF